MAIKIRNISSKKIKNMVNGILNSYNTAGQTIQANTFIEFTDDNKTTIKTAVTKIDGLAMTKATAIIKGKVWILQ